MHGFASSVSVTLHRQCAAAVVRKILAQPLEWQMQSYAEGTDTVKKLQKQEKQQRAACSCIS
ncbi:hypothetical protein M419DRAFT_128505 [Trichoderma reesei RUT C-30]|uniref:Uncharacterized protein n=1 Tax=Hypocrea jecorina (strain ATCC 56765 / BCRC 32924 / NRRL 11460 / Rut C-30) TaxID=1344414 RepID=A0A024SFB2_HYPJR|nr:hypothetical protein M419DRAFT_128505 [Trichoderma reesei RUT C-30]